MSVVACAFAGALAGLISSPNVNAAHAASMGSAASMTVLSESDLAIEMLFVDAAGNTMTVEFTRTDVDSPWLPVQQLRGDRGIGFGNQSPRLPTLALLRERELSPALVVRPFEPGFYTGEIDDLTLYQLAGGQLAVAVHHNGMVVSIGYAGHLVHSAFTIPSHVRVCNILQRLCCDGVNSPPQPDIESCRNAVRYCSRDVRDAVCSCQYSWCDGNVNHPPSCNFWIECCYGSNVIGASTR